MKSKPATLLRGTVITVDSDRRVIDDGGVVVTGETISAVGPFSAVRADYPAATIVGDSRDLVVPGFINGHQHLTGDRLLQATIPDDLEPGAAIFEWAVPLHASHTPEDDELSATLALVESLERGITTLRPLAKQIEQLPELRLRRALARSAVAQHSGKAIVEMH